MKTRLEKRGRQVYILAAFIRWAAFRFLAITTALFIWVSFHGYFTAKVGPQFAAILGGVAVVVMFLLIDKGLDTLIEFLADEKMSPTKEAGADPKAQAARAWFFRVVVFLAVIRLLATGTTSIWGSYEIAEFVTTKPDEKHITDQMQTETAALDKSRTSLEKSLSDAKRTEAKRVKEAKAQGAAMVASSLTHPDARVNAGIRKGSGWYATTPKLRKYQQAYKKAVADSAALVTAEMRKAADLESSLVALNTTGTAKAQEIKDKLAAVAVQEAQGYEDRKARRTNFLIIADFIAVFFGLLAIWIQSTYRAAVGHESELEGKTLEGIVGAALKKYWAAFLGWFEKVLRVDLDGDGKVGSVGGVSTVAQYPSTTDNNLSTVVATVDNKPLPIGFFGSGSPIANGPQDVNSQQEQQVKYIKVNAQQVKELQAEIYRTKRSISADKSNLTKSEAAETNPNMQKAGNIGTIKARIARKEQQLMELERQLDRLLA